MIMILKKLSPEHSGQLVKKEKIKSPQSNNPIE